jgi:beta-fructofuranosidase
MGYMWECPDFFTLNGKRVLMFSPQGMQAAGFSNRNLFQSGYLIGEWQPGQRFIRHGEFREMDNGHDFYAPQSFATPDGRRIVIGWLDMWESPLPEQQDGWAGMLSLPRELSLSADDRLQMRPAKEVESLRGAWFPWPVSTLNNQQTTMVDNCAGTAPAAAPSSMVCALAMACASTWMPNSSVWWWSGIIRSMACAGRAACR